MNVHNRILEIVNDYDYNNEVEKGLSNYKKFLANDKSNDILFLNFNCSKEFRGADEEEIANKVANEVINKYKLKEKIFIKLMSEGIIYPIGLTDGWERHRVDYIIGETTTNTTLDFRRVLFNEFMKVLN